MKDLRIMEVKKFGQNASRISYVLEKADTFKQ